MTQDVDIYEIAKKLEDRFHRRTTDSITSLGQGVAAIHDFLVRLERSSAEPQRRVWALESLDNSCRELAQAQHASYTLAVTAAGISVSFTPRPR